MDIGVPHKFLYSHDITATFNEKAAYTMPGEHMDTTTLFDPCHLLIVHEHSVNPSSFPTSTEVSIEERLSAIDLKKLTDFKITHLALSLGAIIESETLIISLSESFIRHMSIA